MASKFSELPNNLIIKIIQIENDRRKCEKERMKFGEVIQELNKLSTIDIYCPSIRDMMEVPLVCGGGEGQGECRSARGGVAATPAAAAATDCGYRESSGMLEAT